MVQMTGLEPTRTNVHYPLKVACLPIPPHLHIAIWQYRIAKMIIPSTCRGVKPVFAATPSKRSTSAWLAEEKSRPCARCGRDRGRLPTADSPPVFTAGYYRSHLSHSARIWSRNLARSLLAPPALWPMTSNRREPAVTSRAKAWLEEPFLGPSSSGCSCW